MIDHTSTQGIPSKCCFYVIKTTLFTTSLLKIYLAAHHHSNQIHVLEEQLAQNNGGDMANAVREGKAAVGTFYVYLVFLICYQARDTGLST